MNRVINKYLKNAASQHGSIVIFFVIMLPILLGTMGLALDIGKFYVIKSELQNAADSCALAAAYELDGTSTQFTRANAAGLNLAAKNKVFFKMNSYRALQCNFQLRPVVGTRLLGLHQQMMVL